MKPEVMAKTLEAHGYKYDKYLKGWYKEHPQGHQGHLCRLYKTKQAYEALIEGLKRQEARQ
jgi:hypothetical protein